MQRRGETHGRAQLSWMEPPRRGEAGDPDQAHAPNERKQLPIKGAAAHLVCRLSEVPHMCWSDGLKLYEARPLVRGQRCLEARWRVIPICGRLHGPSLSDAFRVP